MKERERMKKRKKEGNKEEKKIKGREKLGMKD